MRAITYREALREGLAEEMRRDERLFPAVSGHLVRVANVGRMECTRWKNGL